MANTDGALIVGIEGGGTWTKAILINQQDKVLAEVTGPSTNHWLTGMDDYCKRISSLVKDLKLKAGLPEDTAINAMGLSTAGTETQAEVDKVTNAIMSRHPDICQSLFVCNDSHSPLGAVSPDEGGIVLISGTGAIVEVYHRDGTRHRAGGYGHIIAAEPGGAYQVVIYCLETIFFTLDGLRPCPHDITTVKNILFKYFKITSVYGIYEQLYDRFDMGAIAGACVEIAKEAHDSKDPLCVEAMRQCGHWLGRHVLAIAPKLQQYLFEEEGGLNIICTGSVFKSWDLLEEGFVAGLRPRSKEDVEVRELMLLQPLVQACRGAAYLAARSATISLTVDYSNNSKPFYHYKV